MPKLTGAAGFRLTSAAGFRPYGAAEFRPYGESTARSSHPAAARTRPRTPVTVSPAHGGDTGTAPSSGG
ncbi:hypothetical protein CD790_28985 [Streptomyces sp. SAJ15]|nr:hypothetical protein CD790_28985 [Streptomyces sp. SAJ15]